MLDLVDKALEFATEHHDGQTRKNDRKTPYIYHPAMAGYYLTVSGCSEEVIAAAILHDTVEDTEATLDDIEREFGERVRHLVDCSTEDKSGTWEERKQSQMDGIGHYDRDALLVKLSDKLQNISCTVRQIKSSSRKDCFKNMKRGYEKQQWYFRGLLAAFEARKEINTHPIFIEFREKVNLVFPLDSEN